MMNAKYLIRQAAMTCLIAVFIAAHSMIAFAGNEKTVGNLLVVSSATTNEESIVKVNGEAAVSGRSIFSSSIIETNDRSGAVISAGKLGKIELAANSKFVITFDNNTINGDLMAGSVAVINSTEAVNINVNGEKVKLNAGESATVGEKNLPANAAAQKKGGWGWWPWTLIVVGGAAAVFVTVAATGSNDFQFGNSVTVVSPTR